MKHVINLTEKQKQRLAKDFQDYSKRTKASEKLSGPVKVGVLPPVRL